LTATFSRKTTSSTLPKHYDTNDNATFLEKAGINKLELEITLVASAILFYQSCVGKLALCVLVEVFHVGMRRCRVGIKIVLFYILAVIAFAAGEAEKTFFEDRITAVPQSQGEADELVLVGNAGKTILTPAVGAAARLIVREEIPCGPIWAIVLAHGAPLPLREIGTPALPVCLALPVFLS
jgi:hypothetical protein